MDYPPSKRLRGLSHDAPVVQDPFGEEDFTQDDLDEIDIIASQAIIGDLPGPDAPPAVGSVTTHLGGKTGPQVHEGRKTFALGGSSHGSGSKAFGTCQPQKSREEMYYNNLEAEHADLKKKLKEVEEDILMKNGEIRVLRDSLRTANQEKEQQRQAQLLLERERGTAQRDREKELSKKIQSLQSELHFKEAEMNEMKSKLQSSERSGKQVSTPTTRNSPKLASPAPGRGSLVWPGGREFLTKETFTAEVSNRSTPNKSGALEDGKPTDSTSSHKEEPPASSSPRFGTQLRQGPSLLDLLLQHPLEPSGVGLCHLLCLCPDALPGTPWQWSHITPGSSTASSSSSSECSLLPRGRANPSQLQSLALSALSTLALHQHPGPSAPDPADPTAQPSSTGAVHLLPLLTHHVSLYCQALESLDPTGKNPLHPGSLAASPSSGSASASTVEESLASLEEFALAATRVFYHLASQSPETVRAVLWPQGPQQEEDERPGETLPGRLRGSEAPGAAGEEALDRHPLLRRLLQLADPALVGGGACQREAVLNSSLRGLCALATRAPDQLLHRLKCVLSSQVLTRCASSESSYQTLRLSLRLLALVASSDEVATQLCSHFYACPFLKIFQYIISRPEQSITEDKWACLEVEVVRLLTNLFARRKSAWAAFVESPCQCNSEVVRTVVLVLRRQWLGVRGREGHAPSAGPRLQLLREGLMLLHWLLLNDAAFSEHCLDVLHVYDQLVPAIRDTLRQVPDLSESEELALEELCRSESEDAEDMDIDGGP